MASIREIDTKFRQDLRLWFCRLFLVLLPPVGLYRLLMGQVAVAVVDLVWAGSFGLVLWAIRSGRASMGAGIAMAAVSMVCCAYNVHALGVEGLAWLFPVLIGMFAVTTRGRAATLALFGITYCCFFATPFTSVQMGMTFAVAAGLVSVIAYVSVSHVERLSAKLERIALHDPLTKAGNRRAMDAFTGEIIRGADSGRAAVAAVIDLDHFKRINDSAGHAAGDRVLVETAELVRSLAHPTGRLFRLGGEEFVLLFPGTSREDAAGLLEVIRAAIRDRKSVV